MIKGPVFPQFAPKCKNCKYINSGKWQDRIRFDAYICTNHKGHKDRKVGIYWYAIDEYNKYKNLDIANDTFRKVYFDCLDSYKANMLLEVD